MQAQENQTIFDIALQEFGSAEAAFEIARINNLQIDTVLLPGREIILPSNLAELPINNQVKNYYKNNEIEPATGTNETFKVPLVRILNPILIGTQAVGVAAINLRR